VMFLIVIEAESAGSAYHYQPYRIASSLSEAHDMMSAYMSHGTQADWLAPTYVSLYTERGGMFTDQRFVCPERLEMVDNGEAGDWLARAGRI
jgi:hypothetical protein